MKTTFELTKSDLEIAIRDYLCKKNISLSADKFEITNVLGNTIPENFVLKVETESTDFKHSVYSLYDR